MTSRGLGALVALALAAAPASAAAGERPAREGFYIGFAVGGGGLFGTIEDASLERGVRGAGGAASLRVGTAATADLLWILQLDTTNYLVDVDGDLRINQASSITLGGQYYLREAFWLKGGVGFAGFIRRDRDSQERTQPDLGGLSVMGSGGLDVFRKGRFVVDLEAAVTVGGYKEGGIATTAFMLGFNWY
jgi:hypothetical protein